MYLMKMTKNEEVVGENFFPFDLDDFQQEQFREQRIPSKGTQLSGQLMVDKPVDIIEVRQILANGFLVSNALLTELIEFRLAENHQFPTKVKLLDGKKVDYCYIQFMYNDFILSDVDFKASLFDEFDSCEKRVVNENITFENENHLRAEWKKQLSNIDYDFRHTKLKLNSFVERFDIFPGFLAFREFFLSDNLAEFLLERKVEGIELEKIDYVE